MGVTVCYELSTKKGEKLANSRLFPLNGPAHVSAYVEIEKQYHFNALYDNSNPQKRALELIFDTPESTEKRKVSIKFEGARSPKAYFSAEVVSPYKSAKAEVGFTNDEKELVVYGQANSDAQQYLLKLGFKKGGSGARREYTPIIEYNNPEAIPYKVSGKVIADSSAAPKTRYTFDKLTVEPAQSGGKFGPLVVDGYFEHDKTEHFDTDLNVKYKDNSANVKGKVVAKKHEFEADLSLLSDVAEFTNGRVKIHYKFTNNHCKNSFVLVYGRDLESTTKRIEFTTDNEYEKKDDKYTSVKVKNTLNIAPIPVKLVINGGIHKNHVDYEFVFGYGKNEIESKLNAEVSKKSKGDWDIKFEAAANTHKVEFASNRDIDETKQRSAVKHELKSSFGTDIVLKSEFDNNFNAQKIDYTADGSVVLAYGQKPLKLNFKLLVTPKQGLSSGKVIADTTDFITFNAVLNRNGGDANAPTTGTIDLTVQEFVTAHGDYNSQKGVGKSELVVTFAKFNRKVKVDTKYEVSANKFDLRNDFYYDYEKDNTRHVAFDTKNKYTSNSLDSVNDIEINGEKFHFEIDGTKNGELKNGKINGKFLLRLPTQREITGTLDRQFEYSAPKASGHGNIKITDTITQGGRKTRSVELDATLKDGNRDQRLFDIVHKLTLTDFDGKSIVVDNHINHLPKGHFKSALANLKVTGSIPHPVELNVVIDEYCAVHAVYNANFKYGNAGTVQLSGDYYVGEAGKKPNTYKLSGQLSVPQSKLKQLSFDTRGSLKYPDLTADPNGQFDYDFKFNSKLNEKNVDVNTNGKFGKTNGDLSLNIKLPETDPFAVDLDYNYDRKPEQQSYHGTGSVQIRYGNGKNIKFSGDGKVVEGKELSYHGSISTPYEKAKSLDFSFKGLKKDENTYSTEVALNIDDRKYKLSNVVVTSQLSPSFTLDVYYPQDKHSQISVVVSRIADRKYKLSVRLVNINNFQLTGDVELSFQSVENFGLVVDLDSAALKANKFHLDIHSKQNGNNKGIEFSATEQNKNIISGTADYLVKQEKGKTTVEGKGNVNWYDKSSALSFQFVRNTFTQAENNETGVSVSKPKLTSLIS